MSSVWLVIFSASLAFLFLVFRFVTRARRRRALPRAVRELIPESKYIEAGGARLHYVQAGRGPDIVLLHGIGASVYIWRFLFPLLEVNHRVTAIDLPGFGRSCKESNRDYGLDAQAEVIATGLKALGIDQAALIGSSMGGAIALWCAKRWPDRFTKIVAMAPAVEGGRIPAGLQFFAAAAPVFRPALNRRTMRILLGRIIARRELIKDDVIRAYLEPFSVGNGEGLRAFWSALSLLSDRRLPSELFGVKAKVLVIYGDRDLMVPRRALSGLFNTIPSAELLTHEHGGHHIMEDEPEWTARAVEEFLARKT